MNFEPRSWSHFCFGRDTGRLGETYLVSVLLCRMLKIMQIVMDRWLWSVASRPESTYGNVLVNGGKSFHSCGSCWEAFLVSRSRWQYKNSISLSFTTICGVLTTSHPCWL